MNKVVCLSDKDGRTILHIKPLHIFQRRVITELLNKVSMKLLPKALYCVDLKGISAYEALCNNKTVDAERLSRVILSHETEEGQAFCSRLAVKIFFRYYQYQSGINSGWKARGTDYPSISELVDYARGGRGLFHRGTKTRRALETGFGVNLKEDSEVAIIRKIVISDFSSK